MDTQEIQRLLGEIRAAQYALDDAAAAVLDAREVMRDTAALIDAMSDELAELSKDA